MKIAVIIVRVLMGLLFLSASIPVLLNMIPPEKPEGNVKVFMDGIEATGYLMPLIKITELLCGIAFVSGYFVPLATVVIAPIVINIFLFHAFVDKQGVGIGVGLALVLANLFLAYAHREKFKPILAAK